MSGTALGRLKEMLGTESAQSAVVFLGDNIYCCGLPDSASAKRAQAEMRIDAAIDAVAGFAGRIIFIPGNHDWGDSGSISRETLLRQQRYIEERLGKDTFLPQNGFPGPTEVKLTDEIRLIAIDTQWWMLDDKPFGDTGEYEVEEDADFLLELRELLAKRDDEHILLVGHHPLISYGEHGGHFSLKDHLFPLTNFWKNAWLPLPIIGSLYPFIRSIAGGDQDISNRNYQALQGALLSLFQRHDGNLVYASGHDHNLQHIVEGITHLVVSGSGSRPGYVSRFGSAAFTSEEEGFMVLDYLSDGSVQMRAESAFGETIYQTNLFAAATTAVGQAQHTDEDELTVPPIPDGPVTRAMDVRLGASGFKEAFWGSNNRLAWTTPVEVPVFDVSKIYGGLTPLKRGGGLQTTSLRLEDKEGYQYVLRSLDKDPSRTIPIEFQGTFVSSVVEDQISIMNPFAALMVPPLAKAAGIYYTRPRLYYVPMDRGFSPFTELMGDQMSLFERRPDDDMSAFENYGYSDDVISTPKMYRNMLEDNDNRVDALFYARSRLFDMYISDWDRHPDQWRWATFEDPDGKGDLYRPIPRDRDFSFNRVNGFFPTIYKSRWMLPRFQDFRPDYGLIWGLNKNGMPQDRRFVSALTEKQWVAIAQELVDSIDSSDMREAVDQLPKEVRPLYEAELLSTLASRLSQLPKVASQYYHILARYVDVLGSDKHERFTVIAAEDSVTVTMSKVTKKGEFRQDLYRRVFYPDETEEIRLYGFGGNDRFVLSGSSGFPIRIYAVGGSGEDQFQDLTTGSVVRRNWFVRDTPEESTMQQGASTRDQLTRDVSIHDYSPFNFWFEPVFPIIIFSTNPEDGVVLGGGITHTSRVFHRQPFSTKHTVQGSIASRSRAFTFNYEGLFAQRFGDWGVIAKASARSQGNVQNFYGFGSNTRRPVSRASFYRSEMQDYHLDLGFFRDWYSTVNLRVTSLIEFADVDESRGGFATLPQAGLPDDALSGMIHTGISGTIEIDRRDNPVYPLSGFRWVSSIRSRIGLNDESNNFTSLSSQFSFYFTPGINRKTTIAGRFGASHVTGDFPYFRSATVGSRSGLRGWRRDRFSGNSALYQNIELRRELFTFSGILAIGRGGVSLFLDNGRVFSGNEDGGAWHQGYGGGFWLNIFDMAIFQISVGASEEETLINTGLGFEF